jgi:flagellar hook-basal body complex protein FliE
MDALRSIQSPNSIEHVKPLEPAGQSKTADFASVLQSAIRTVESSNATAGQAVEDFITGRGGELHSTVLATQRAALQFEMFLQVRNKVVQAYQEVMRMQL